LAGKLAANLASRVEGASPPKFTFILYRMVPPLKEGITFFFSFVDPRATISAVKGGTSTSVSVEKEGERVTFVDSERMVVQHQGKNKMTSEGVRIPSLVNSTE